MLFGTRRHSRSDRVRRRRRPVSLFLEALEDRLTPSTDVVVGTTLAEATIATAKTAIVNEAAATQSAAVAKLDQQAASVSQLSQAQASLLTNTALTTLSQQSANANALGQVQSSLLTNAASAGTLTQQAAASAMTLSQSQAALTVNAAAGTTTAKGPGDPTSSSQNAARGASQQSPSQVSASTAGSGSKSSPASEPAGESEANGESPLVSALASTRGTASSDSAPSAGTVSLAFTPGRLIYAAGSPSVAVMVTVVNSATGSPISGGTVTFTLTDLHGVPLSPSVAAVVSSSGQASAAYPLPADLAAGNYTLRASYSSDDGSLSGSGSEPLSVVLPPAPAQQLPGSASAALGLDPPALEPPPSPPPSLFQAALTLYLDGAEMVLDQLTGHDTSAVQANIDFNTPYASVYAPLLVLAGELAASHAIRPPQ